MKCQQCNTTVKKENKAKHEQSKTHKFFSILVLKKYVVKDIAIDTLKDVITSH